MPFTELLLAVAVAMLQSSKPNNAYIQSRVVRETACKYWCNVMFVVTALHGTRYVI